MKSLLTLVFTVITIQFSLADVIGIHKYQPIKEVNYNWNINRQLDIWAVLNLQKFEHKDSVSSNYVLLEDLDIKLTSYGWNNGKQIMSNVQLPNENNESNTTEKLKYTLRNTNLNKVSYSDPIKGNSWTRFKFKFFFQVKGSSERIESLEFPLYKNETSIGTIPNEELELTVKEFTFLENNVVLKLSSNKQSEVIKEVKVFPVGEDDNRLAKLNRNEQKNILSGNSLLAHLIADNQLQDNERYDISVETVNDEIYWIKNEATKEDKEFFIKAVKIIDLNDPSIEKLWVSKDQRFNKQLRKIKIQTNSDSFSSTQGIQLQLLRDPSELFPTTSQTIHNTTLDSEGNGTFDVDLSKLNDGLYRLSFTGVAIVNGSGKKVDLQVEEPYFVTLDSKNTLKSLKFDYKSNEVSLTFKLKEIVDKSLVRISDTKSGVTFPSSLTSNLYTAKVNGFSPNIFNSYNIEVAGNPIFEFSFKVVSENDVKQVVQKAITDNISMSKDAIKDLKNPAKKKSAIDQVTKDVTEKLISNGEVTADEKSSFVKSLESLVTSQVEELAKRNKKTLDDKGFWGSTFGQITKSVGNLALKYLGVVVA